MMSAVSEVSEAGDVDGVAMAEITLVWPLHDQGYY